VELRRGVRWKIVVWGWWAGGGVGVVLEVGMDPRGGEWDRGVSSGGRLVMGGSGVGRGRVWVGWV